MNRLTVDCATGAHRRDALARPELLGPLDVALRAASRSATPRLVLGIGPLHRSDLPGSHRLAICGPSPLWGGPYLSTMGSAGLALAGLGLDVLELHGRAPRPSWLHVTAQGVRVHPLDGLTELWAAQGVRGLLMRAAARAEEDDAWVLGVGAAAAASRFGAVGAAPVARLERVRSWAGRGGLGSQLLGAHGLAAILLDAPARKRRPAPPAPAGSVRPASGVDIFPHDPRLRAEGTLAANLDGLADRVLAFNGRSARWPAAQRHEVIARLVGQGLLSQVRERRGGGLRGGHCGETCPIACRREHEGQRLDFQPFASLGPNLGVFDLDAVSRLHRAGDRAGFDAVELGGVLGWVLENDPASRFTVDDFDLVADSQSNAARAEHHLGRLLAGAAPELAGGLAAAARAAPAAARDRAVYLSSGPEHGLAPIQYWTPGVLAPTPLGGRYHTYFGTEYVPVARLGRLCAERAIAEVALDNLGLCRFQQEWAEDQLDALLARSGGRVVDVRAHHRALAARLLGDGRRGRWETVRTRALVAGHLRAARDAGVDEPGLGRWLARFDEDPVAAADAYWGELRDGIRAGLTAS